MYEQYRADAYTRCHRGLRNGAQCFHTRGGVHSQQPTAEVSARSGLRVRGGCDSLGVTPVGSAVLRGRGEW